MTEQELLAIVESIKEFKDMLWGQTVAVYRDNKKMLYGYHLIKFTTGNYSLRNTAPPSSISKAFTALLWTPSLKRIIDLSHMTGTSGWSFLSAVSLHWNSKTDWCIPGKLHRIPEFCVGHLQQRPFYLSSYNQRDSSITVERHTTHWPEPFWSKNKEGWFLKVNRYESIIYFYEIVFV